MKTIHSFCRVDETQYALATDKVNLLYYQLPKHFSGEYHCYDRPRLCTILQGSKEVRINQYQPFRYSKQQCVLLSPYTDVHMSMSEPTRALVYEFSDSLVDSVIDQVEDTLEVKPTLDPKIGSFQLDKLDERLFSLHVRTQEILCSGDANLSFLLDLVSQELVYELLKRQGCNDILSLHQHHPITRIVRLMQSEKGRAMSVSHFAEEVNMSLSRFSQKFKQITGQTPTAYLTEIKLQQAKPLLRQVSVTEAALELGYENISYFIRLFKNKFGLTPKQYQVQYQAGIPVG